MKSPESSNRAIPLHDYRPALRTAVNWLGERYLLAEPVRRRKDEGHGFFATPRSWHPQTARGPR